MKKLLFCVVLTLCTPALFAQSASTVTLTLADGKTMYSNAHATGINIAAYSNYDSGQITQNLFGTLNPGFEPPQVRQLWQLASNGTATSFSTPYPYDLVTKNYWAGATFLVVAAPSGGAELGCTGKVTANTGWMHITGGVRTGGVTTLTTMEDPTGYIGVGTAISFDQQSPTTFSSGNGDLIVTAVTSSSISYNQKGLADGSTTERGIAGPNKPPTFTVPACASNFKAGDQVTLTTNFTSSTEADLETTLGSGGYYIDTLANGGRITPDITDLCATCGLQALTLDATTPRSQVGINLSWDTSFINNFVMINYPVTISFWAKIASGSPTLSLTTNRSISGGLNCAPYSPTLTSTWAQYSFNCTGTETGSVAPQPIRNHVLVTGGAVYFDNFSFARTTPAQSTFLRDENYNDLVAFKPATVRYWLGQNGETESNWTAPDYARRPTGGGANNYYPNQVRPSLTDYLTAVKSIGSLPYIEIPVTFSNTEGAALVTWLSTNGWLSQFPKIYLTFCNECWNPSFIGDSIMGNTVRRGADSYTDLGIRTRSLFSAMRAATGFSRVIKLGFDIQTGNTGGLAAILASARPDYVEQQGYTYFQVNSAENDTALWTPALAQVYSMMTSASDPTGFSSAPNLLSSHRVCGASGTAACPVYTYEQAVSTWNGSLSQASQDSITAGAGQGTIAALQFLLEQDTFPSHFGAQNYFGYTGFNGASFNRNRSKTWGAIVDAGGSTNNKRPQFITMAMANAAILPNRFPCTFGSGNTYNFAGSTQNGSNTVPAVNNVPQVYAFCYESGTQRSMILINATLFSQTVKLEGTNLPGSTAYVSYAPSSPDLLNEAASGTSTNGFAAQVATTSGTLSSPTSISLVPFGMETLSWNTANK